MPMSRSTSHEGCIIRSTLEKVCPIHASDESWEAVFASRATNETARAHLIRFWTHPGRTPAGFVIAALNHDRLSARQTVLNRAVTLPLLSSSDVASRNGHVRLFVEQVAFVEVSRRMVSLAEPWNQQGVAALMATLSRFSMGNATYFQSAPAQRDITARKVPQAS